ncbi:MAG TPA: alpha/beta family hydrolase [Gemmatimonadales bacterium]|nr:alpha/beta family hydrolase [Gemmatimonadales bacterium]
MSNAAAPPIQLDIDVGLGIGHVSGLLVRPAEAWLLYVLAHGAGAGMRHHFLERIVDSLAARGVATLRYHFPYMESGSRRPDAPAVAHATVRAAVALATELAPDLTITAGGKSFGGRMTSQAAAELLPGIHGLAFLGFPLHPPGRPATSRADHLDSVELPMLFLQGTRDQFAQIDLISSVSARLGERAILHVIEGADHSFNVPKRVGRSASDVMDELADTIVLWARSSVLRKANR